MKTTIIIAALSLISITPALPAENALLAPIAKLNKRLILSDSFDRAFFAASTGSNGKWRSVEKKVANGNKIQPHQGVLQVEHPREIRHPLGLFWDLAEEAHSNDVAVFARFRFTREDHQFTLGLTGDNQTKGHNRICMFTVKPGGYKISDATGKGSHVAKEVKLDLALNDWQAVLLVIRGNRCEVFMNGKPSTVLESKGLGCEKHTLKLGTGTGFEVDELKMWTISGASDSL